MNSEKKTLPPGYRFVELPTEKFKKLWNDWGEKIFTENDSSMDFQKVFSEEEWSQVRVLQKNMSQLIRMNLCIFKGDEFCGWSD